MNTLIQHCMLNHDILKEWYWSLMENNSIPGLGGIEGLPTDLEKKAETIAILMVTTGEAMALDCEEVQTNAEELIEAVNLFRVLMCLEKFERLGFIKSRWDMLDENFMPSFEMSKEGLEKQAEFFGVEIDPNNQSVTVENLLKMSDKQFAERWYNA